MKNIGDCIDNYRILQNQPSSALYDRYIVELVSQPGTLYVLQKWNTVHFDSNHVYNAFCSQMISLKALREPLILSTQDFGVDTDDHPYLLLPYETAQMETIADRWQRSALTEDESEKILMDVSAALVLAHQHDLIHGFFSPESVYLTPEGGVCVAAFLGSSAEISIERDSFPVRYRFPDSKVSRLSDQYALAGLVQELLLEQGGPPEDATILRRAIARAQAQEPMQRFKRIRDFLGEVGISLHLAESDNEIEVPIRDFASSPTEMWSRTTTKAGGTKNAAILTFLSRFSLLRKWRRVGTAAWGHVLAVLPSWAKLAQRLSLWLFLGGIVLIIVLHLTGSDWADGALHASRAALVIGIVLVFALIVQLIAGLNPSLKPIHVRQRVISITCILFLFIYSFIAQALQPTLHVSQGASLEAQQQWQQAINEYTMGGERSSTSVYLARTYTSWGLALSMQHHHNEALVMFNTVITQFDSPMTSAQVRRAQGGDISVRLGLAQQNMQAKDYNAAINKYNMTLKLFYCTTDCKTNVSNLDAIAFSDLGQSYVAKKNYQQAVIAFDTVLNNFSDAPAAVQARTLDAVAYYNLGKDHLQAKNYNDAVKTFDALKSRFPNALEVKQSHGYMSKALLGYGQQTRASNCSRAIPTYQRLTKEYGDTNEGKQAQYELNAPQTVKGRFFNDQPNITFSQIALTQGLVGGMPADVLFNKWDNAYMKATIDSKGNFIFSNVSQGTYDFLWYANDGISEHIAFIYFSPGMSPFETIGVGPLCAVTRNVVS